MTAESSDILENQVRDSFLRIAPGRLGLTKRPEISSIKKLELGQANLNYLLTTTNERKYVFIFPMWRG